jgi:Plasmid pRiA4b ORF-3-like protein
MSAASIARLKITLDDVKPAVLRRIEVPLTLRLDRLHLAIQSAMGWTNSHLYEIRAGDVGWGMTDPDWGDGPLDARKARLIDVLEDVGTKTLRYLYDFGDGWEHTIKVERLLDPDPGVVYPRLIEATGRCPPEDIGGPWGTPSSSMRSASPSTSGTSNSKSGSPTNSIRTSSIPRGSPQKSLRSQNAGLEALLRGALDALKPRRSPDGY